MGGNWRETEGLSNFDLTWARLEVRLEFSPASRPIFRLEFSLEFRNDSKLWACVPKLKPSHISIARTKPKGGIGSNGGK